MLTLHKLRELNLRVASAPRRPRHLAAASGLVRAGAYLYVIADDENQLGVFPAEGSAPGELIPLFPEALPAGLAERKARKRDLEALTRLPPLDRYPHGALLALGSGSTANRAGGVVMALDADGAVAAPAVPIDLAALYAAIRTRFGPLNIEGAFVLHGELCLLHRGHNRDRRNACIRLQLRVLSETLDAPATASPPFDLQEFELGEIEGIPFTFTDGAALADGRFVFTAVAEDTDDSYADGACVGAAVGIASTGGRIEAFEPVVPVRKFEGIDARHDSGAIRLLLVTDADDACVPAMLFAGTLG